MFWIIYNQLFVSFETGFSFELVLILLSQPLERWVCYTYTAHLTYFECWKVGLIK